MDCFIKRTITIIGLLCCFSIGQASMNGGTSGTVTKPSITLNSLSFTESGAEIFTATLSNIPADYSAKGYRIEWGNNGIVTGMTRSRDPYQITGVLREGFRASDGDLTVRLLKDSVVVAEASLLSSPTPIIVSNKTICSGDVDRTITAEVPSWEPGYWIRWTDDAWHVDPGLEITGNTTVRISDNYSVGEHMLWAFLFNSTGNLVGSANFKLTILPGPLAEIEDLSGCVSPGAGFTLSARASDNCTYLWDYGSVSRNSEVGLTIDGVMENEDLQYILKVTDKSNGCVSSDTSIVRSAPAAPQVAIDTNTNRLDIKIHWSSVNGAMGYNVYSRRWDPYCLTSENGGAYTKTAVTSLAHTRSSANVASDTLAFFYVTSTNGICESSTSDTVGYKLDNILVNTNGKSSLNLIVAYFDFAQMGLPTTNELLLKPYSSNLLMVRKWSFALQDWEFSYAEEGEVINPFVIDLGMVLQLEAKNSFKLLQYGTLPKVFEFELKNSNASPKFNNNIVFLQPFRATLTNSGDVFTEMPELSFIRWWNFEQQDWKFTYMEEGEVIGAFKLRPILMPLQMELLKDITGPVRWK